MLMINLRFGLNLFRLHFQFIMAADRRAPYDYLMLIGSPLPVPQWARRGSELVAAFAEDGAYAQVSAAPAMT